MELRNLNLHGNVKYHGQSKFREYEITLLIYSKNIYSFNSPTQVCSLLINFMG